MANSQLFLPPLHLCYLIKYICEVAEIIEKLFAKFVLLDGNIYTARNHEKKSIVSYSGRMHFICCCTNSRQVDNQKTFAKIFGYVRYFYPGDEAAALD
jgi:hypothetical protein